MRKRWLLRVMCKSIISHQACLLAMYTLHSNWLWPFVQGGFTMRSRGRVWLTKLICDDDRIREDAHRAGRNGTEIFHFGSEDAWQRAEVSLKRASACILFLKVLDAAHKEVRNRCRSRPVASSTRRSGAVEDGGDSPGHERRWPQLTKQRVVPERKATRSSSGRSGREEKTASSYTQSLNILYHTTATSSQSLASVRLLL